MSRRKRISRIPGSFVVAAVCVSGFWGCDVNKVASPPPSIITDAELNVDNCAIPLALAAREAVDGSKLVSKDLAMEAFYIGAFVDAKIQVKKDLAADYLALKVCSAVDATKPCTSYESQYELFTLSDLPATTLRLEAASCVRPDRAIDPKTLCGKPISIVFAQNSNSDVKAAANFKMLQQIDNEVRSYAFKAYELATSAAAQRALTTNGTNAAIESLVSNIANMGPDYFAMVVQENFAKTYGLLAEKRQQGVPSPAALALAENSGCAPLNEQVRYNPFESLANPSVGDPTTISEVNVDTPPANVAVPDPANTTTAGSNTGSSTPPGEEGKNGSTSEADATSGGGGKGDSGWSPGVGGAALLALGGVAAVTISYLTYKALRKPSSTAMDTTASEADAVASESKALASYDPSKGSAFSTDAMDSPSDLKKTLALESAVMRENTLVDAEHARIDEKLVLGDNDLLIARNAIDHQIAKSKRLIDIINAQIAASPLEVERNHLAEMLPKHTKNIEALESSRQKLLAEVKSSGLDPDSLGSGRRLPTGGVEAPPRGVISRAGEVRAAASGDAETRSGGGGGMAFGILGPIAIISVVSVFMADSTLHLAGEPVQEVTAQLNQYGDKILRLLGLREKVLTNLKQQLKP